MKPTEIWAKCMKSELKELGDIAMNAAVIVAAFAEKLGHKEVIVRNTDEGISLDFVVDERE